MNGVAETGRLRCARHPGRPAQDECPSCGRTRCAADVETVAAAGCLICRVPASRSPRTPLLLVAARAAATSLPTAALGGWVATQYVQTHIFSLVVPGLVGFGCALAAAVANRRPERVAVGVVLAVAAIAALLGTALGFYLVPGGRQSVFSPLNVVVAPYLCALAGVVVWPMLFGTTGRRRLSRANDVNGDVSW